MASGKVVHFDDNRGFGFLAPDEGGPDVFVHINDLNIDSADLTPGTEVSFAIEESDRGLKATDVKITGEVAPVAERSFGRKNDHRANDRNDRGDRGFDRGDRNDRGDRFSRGGSRGGYERRGGRNDDLSERQLNEEITELLLDASPTLTAQQILAIRQSVLDFASARGWVAD